jgi:glycosyltransferase involved in cell wall biosynthesis
MRARIAETATHPDEGGGSRGVAEASFCCPQDDMPKPSTTEPRIAILVPCYNEEAAIGNVIVAFRRELPDATIYVYDNNSTDRTMEIARESGAVVVLERLQGKGHVIRRMFADIEADAYLLVDGDDTYEAASAPEMIRKLISEELDMVTGTRVTQIRAAYRPGHRFGNILLTKIAATVFGNRITDMLSGYRVFSRRFVKSFPAISSGFETETEFTNHALELKMPLGEIETPYRDRAEGSVSKLNTYRDGIRILLTIINLIRDQRPLQFFASVATAVGLLGVGLSIPIFEEYSRTHLVPRFPTAILSMGLVLLSFILLVCGLILDSVSRGRKEFKRMIYLSVPRFR